MKFEFELEPPERATHYILSISHPSNKATVYFYTKIEDMWLFYDDLNDTWVELNVGQI